MSFWSSIKRSKGAVALVTVGSIVTLAFSPVFYYMTFAPKVDGEVTGQKFRIGAPANSALNFAWPRPLLYSDVQPDVSKPLPRGMATRGEPNAPSPTCKMLHLITAVAGPPACRGLRELGFTGRRAGSRGVGRGLEVSHTPTGGKP
jgi:hypothetical protein